MQTGKYLLIHQEQKSVTNHQATWPNFPDDFSQHWYNCKNHRFLQYC